MLGDICTAPLEQSPLASIHIPHSTIEAFKMFVDPMAIYKEVKGEKNVYNYLKNNNCIRVQYTELII